MDWTRQNKGIKHTTNVTTLVGMRRNKYIIGTRTVKFKDAFNKYCTIIWILCAALKYIVAEYLVVVFPLRQT